MDFTRRGQTASPFATFIAMPGRTRPLLYLLFTLSGASALIYQVVWTRQLTLVAGATTPAVSTVLALFMLGLALGAGLFGRIADRTTQPLRWYAALEIALGLFALAQPALLAGLSQLYFHLLPGDTTATANLIAHASTTVSASAIATTATGAAASATTPGLGVLALRVGLAAALLLLPATLMGGTLPLLVRFVTRSAHTLGRNLGTLYGANLLGAILGTALAGFVLLRHLGVSHTLHVAVAINLLVGVAAWLLARKQSTDTPGGSAATAAATAASHVPDGSHASPTSPALPQTFTPAASLRRLLWLTLALSGLLTMAYEVAWTRMLVFAFGSTVYSFTLILLVFLLGLALGSVVFVRLERRPNLHPATLLAASLLFAAVGALALAPLTAHLPDWLGRASARFGYTGTTQLAGTLAGCCLVMLLPATGMGVVFPLCSRLLLSGRALAHTGRELGRALWVNTLGSVAGALLAGFVLVPLLSLKGTLLALAAVQTTLGLAFLPFPSARNGSPATRDGVRTTRASYSTYSAHSAHFATRTLVGGASVALVALAALAFLRLLPGENPFDRLGYVQGAPVAIEAHRDDATASVTVVRSANGGRALRINGFEASSDSDDAGYMPLMSHLPLLVHGDARPRVLVICFGTGSTAGAALLHPGATVDAVEINPTVLEFAPHFEAVNHHVHRDPRARLLLDDGRNHLARTRAQYDLITSEPMPPTHAGVVSLYSREYYALARERLAPGGVLVQWLPVHLLTPDQARAILRTVQDVFPETTLWLHSDTGLIVARRDAPVTLDWTALTRAYAQNPALAEDLQKLRVPTPDAFAQLFALDAAGVRAFAAGAPAITDDHPSLEFHPPRHRLSLTVDAYAADTVATLLDLNTRRTSSPLPLTNISPADSTRLTTRRQLATHLRTGNLWLRLKRLPEAQRSYNEGLATASGPDRAPFLYALALTALQRGARAEALDLLNQCLVAQPQHVVARQLLVRLRSSDSRN